MTNAYDVLIIGAGVVGNAIARELSRYRLNVGVLEKELDVGMGTSSRNSGVLHSGIHYKPGTLRAKLNVHGNELMKGLCRDLSLRVTEPSRDRAVWVRDGVRKVARKKLVRLHPAEMIRIKVKKDKLENAGKLEVSVE